jgi:hypothetical protein
MQYLYMVISSRYCIHGIDMVAKQLPQATFRISDNELWENFKAKAKANGTNASAVFWQFAKDYVDGNLDSRIDSPAALDVDIESIVNDAVESRLEAVLSQVNNLRLDVQSIKTNDLITQNLQTNLTVAQQRIEALEEIVTAKKPLTLSQNQKVIAIQKLQATA